MSGNVRMTAVDKGASGIELEMNKQKAYPTASAEYVCEGLLPEWEELFLQKNAGYGGMHGELGLRAQYVDIHRKAGKVRRALWEDEDIGPESVREVLMDLIGHCFLTIDLIDKEEKR